LTADFYLVPTLRMSGAVPPLPLYFFMTSQTTLRNSGHSNDTLRTPFTFVESCGHLRRAVSAAAYDAVYVFCMLRYMAGLPYGVFLSGFPIKIPYEILFPWQKN
jgi:hypothetical protein